MSTSAYAQISRPYVRGLEEGWEGKAERLPKSKYQKSRDAYIKGHRAGTDRRRIVWREAGKDAGYWS